jgi:hypothetical protein
MHLPKSLPRLIVRIAAVLATAGPTVLAAQSTPPADPASSGATYDELARADSTLFDAAFVTCDAAKVNAMLAPDVEFYHDVNGMQAGDEVRAQFERLAQGCPRLKGIQRELVPGTLRVYPMNHYGAVQTGVHRFVQANGDPAEEARFIHLWKRVDGRWMLARVISYDHRAGGTPRASGDGR